LGANVDIPARKPTWRCHHDLLAKRFGPQFVLPAITSHEKADSQAYEGQPDLEASEFSRDEKSHARLLSMASHSTGGLSGGTVAQLEGRHKAVEAMPTRRVLGPTTVSVHFESHNGRGGRNKFQTRYFDRRSGRSSGRRGFHGIR
jgi:hypothetical protein